MREFRKELKAAGEELPKELRRLNKEFAEGVASKARSAHSALYPARTGRHQKGIRSLATQRRAQVQLSAAKAAPGLFGQEFGSGRMAQFPPRTPGNKGYFFYPALREAQPELREAYMEALNKLAGAAFPS